MENLRLPHLDKVVGVPKEYSNKVEDLFKSKFQEGGKKLKEYEIEKTEKDLELINFAKHAADDYVRKYGRTKQVTIPSENIHILKEGGVKQITGRDELGLYLSTHGIMLVDRTPRDIDFSLILFHELLHAKSFSVAQLTKAEKEKRGSFTAYRIGFCVVSRNGETVYFKGVNEAIVDLLTQKFFEEYVKKNRLFANEISMDKVEEAPIFKIPGRKMNMEGFLAFIKDIHERNKERYSIEEITEIFIDAGINGNLLKVARLIENTFGKGSFRELGEETGGK